jgi:hypothetical protein
VTQLLRRLYLGRNERIFLPWAVTDCAGEEISMKKIKTKNYLQAYYGSDQTTSCPVRVVLNKVEEPPALKEQHKRKGLYALGSN